MKNHWHSVFTFLFICLGIPGTLFAQNRYLDLEDGQIVSVFNQPGQNWKTCPESKGCEAIGWPDNSATLKVIGSPKKMKVVNPYTNEPADEEYLEVEYEYTRQKEGVIYEQKGRGWIDSAYVSKVKRQAFYADVKKSNPEDCECEPGKKCKEPQKGLTALADTLSNQVTSQTAKDLESLVGQCAVDPKNPQLKPGIPYDNHVIPLLASQKLPKVQKEDGSMMTMQDLLDIDALARTMYGEMASCYKHGLHYPMTVAKIAVNRATNITRHGEFIRGVHKSGKGHLAKVVTSPTQFSVWQQKHNGKTNGPLIMAMCPPQKKGEKFWRGKSAPQEEYDIWKNTLKIASEAVLQPKAFRRRTSSVTQFFYTSGMGAFYKMRLVRPVIEGRSVEKNACVEVWQD